MFTVEVPAANEPVPLTKSGRFEGPGAGRALVRLIVVLLPPASVLAIAVSPTWIAPALIVALDDTEIALRLLVPIRIVPKEDGVNPPIPATDVPSTVTIPCRLTVPPFVVRSPPCTVT